MDEDNLSAAFPGAIAQLSLDELYALRASIDERIAMIEAELAAIPVATGRQIVSVERRGRYTYRQELVRCGKPNCRCARGLPHRPYWYRYCRKGGRLVSEYVGKLWSEN